MAVHRSTVPGSRAVGAGEFISIDFSQLPNLIAAIGALPKELKAELRPAAKEAAQIVADQAKDNASFSSWIPGAITVGAPLSARATATVSVASSKAPSPDHAPLPRLMEFGTPFFRHPVFGGDTWVSQPGHPFLFPAVKEKRAEVTERIAAAVKAAAASVGLV